MISILLLAADPSDASRLRLSEEFREIQEKLQLSRLRDRFVLHQRLSVRPHDISQALLDERPQIIHFSGHGTSDGTLCFENQVGELQSIQPDALAALFEQFANQVNCVILNACYSEMQARAIAEHISYVLGMNQAIGDKAAIAFSVGFYQALGAGCSIEEAYKLGCIQIRLENIPEHLTPVLIKRDKLALSSPKASAISLTNNWVGIESSSSKTDWLVKAKSSREITLADVVLNECTDQYIRETLIPSISNPNEFRYKVSKATKREPEEILLPSQQILLEGPPGSGKTMLAYAIAYETARPLYHFRLGNWLAHRRPSTTITDLFAELHKIKPCIFFIDEIDVVAPFNPKCTDNIAIQIILELDKGLDGDIVFCCATNRPENLDPAFIARMNSITIDLPDQKSRERLVKMYFNTESFEAGLTAAEIASMLENWTPHQIMSFARRMMETAWETGMSSEMTRKLINNWIHHCAFPNAFIVERWGRY